MQKEEIFKQILAKGIVKKEIESKYDEFKAYMQGLSDKSKKDGGKEMTKDQIEQFALSRLMSYYKRIIYSPSKTFEGIIYGVDRETDYGAQKQYDESVEMWTADREKAIAEGFTDTEGNPLYHGKRKPATGTRKIDLEKDRGKPIYLVAKSVEGEQDADFRRAIMTLKPDKFSDDIPLFKLVRFKAIKGTKSTAEIYVLSESQLTEFEVIDNTEVPFIDIAKKYLKDNICPSLKKLVDWHKKHEDDINRQVIIKGNIVDIRLTGEGISNLITLDAPELEMDDKPVTCWIPEDVPIDFDESAMEIIVVGRTNLKEEDDGSESVFVNGVSLWCPEMYKIKRSEEDEIDVDKIEEKVVVKPKQEEKKSEEDKTKKTKETKETKVSAKKTKKDDIDEIMDDDDDDKEEDIGDW